MQAKHEKINYGDGEKVWAGKYKNSQNLLHWHYDCELIYAERGALAVTCDKELYRLTEGQGLFIDSQQLHCIRAERADSLLITFFFDQSLISFAEEFELASPVLSRRYPIPALYGEIIDELRQKNRFYERSTALKMERLMLDVFGNERLAPRRKGKPATESFKKLLTLMRENCEFLTFGSAAEFMNMNPAYFSRFFSKLTGMTFSRYLNCVKVDKAVNMLHFQSDLPITEIALKSGFSTIRNFNRVFKETTGYAPSDLPENFILDETLARTGSAEGNPTLFGCELIESSDF